MRAHPGDGTIDIEELSTMFTMLGFELNDRELQKVSYDSQAKYTAVAH